MHPSCVWQQSEDAVSYQTGQGRSLFESALLHSHQRHEPWFLFPYVGHTAFLWQWYCTHELWPLGCSWSSLIFSLPCLLDEKQLIPAWLGGRSTFLAGRKQISKSSGSHAHPEICLHFPQLKKRAKPEGCYDLGFSISLIFWDGNSICIKAGMCISIKKLWFW